MLILDRHCKVRDLGNVDVASGAAVTIQPPQTHPHPECGSDPFPVPVS